MGHLGAISILSLTIGLSLPRPRVGQVRIQPATAAMFGATLTVAVGLLSPLEAWEVLEFLARPVLTIVSLMIITIVASQAGFFRMLAWRLAKSAGGNTRSLFARLFFAGTITGTLFTNDAAVLIFTPMVYQLVQEIQEPTWTDANRAPFYFAVLYVANLVGALVISNPINIIVADWFGIGFVEYAFWMVIPAFVSMIVTYFGLVLFFRRSIPATYRVPTSIEAPTSAESSSQGRKLRVVTAGVLIATLIGFFSEPWSGIPTAFVAGIGALLLLVIHHFFGAKRTGRVVGEVGVGCSDLRRRNLHRGKWAPGRGPHGLHRRSAPRRCRRRAAGRQLRCRPHRGCLFSGHEQPPDGRNHGPLDWGSSSGRRRTPRHGVRSSDRWRSGSEDAASRIPGGPPVVSDPTEPGGGDLLLAVREAGRACHAGRGRSVPRRAGPGVRPLPVAGRVNRPSAADAPSSRGQREARSRSYRATSPIIVRPDEPAARSRIFLRAAGARR